MITEIAESNGRFERMRKLVHSFLILIFLVMPWIKISGDPLIMMDIWNRHFIIFGHHFFSHDAPLFFFVAIITVFCLVLVTALWGRIFCGWACPQTVFLMSVYRKIETFILGTYLEREKLNKEPLSAEKLFRKSALYLTYLLTSYIISHSFIAYFVGANRMIQFIEDGPQKHFTIFVVLQIVTVLLTINFAWFRHRLCHHICPYGRFQNVLLDTNSLGVLYMKHIGEPRRSNAVLPKEQGNCVDCHRCVNVCPMKIDIRNGFQLECINCAACIDACDEIMTKIKKPTGLIQFSTADSKPIDFKRFRVILYSGIITVALFFFTMQLLNYKSLELELSRSRQNAFMVEKQDGFEKVTNHFEGFIKNQKSTEHKVLIKLSDRSLAKGFQLITQMPEINLIPFDNRQIHIFISKDIRNEVDKSDNEFEIEFKTDEDISIKKFKLLGG